MEGMDRRGADFAQSLTHFARRGLLAHAQAEEAEVFAELRRHLSDERSAALAAPTAPPKATAAHPPPSPRHERPAGQLAAGGIAAVADRVPDAARSAMDKLHSHR